MNVPPPRAEDLLAQADWLHRLARAMLRDPERAHDVAQDTLLAALARPRTHDITNLRAWLQAVARRLANRSVRAEQRRAVRERAAAQPAHGDHDALAADRLRWHRRLCEAVLELPEPYRTAVSMRFFDDLSPRTIAARLGTTSGVVRQRVHRGIALLRERFDASGDGDWRPAFAAVGFGGATPVHPSYLLSWVMMNKSWLAAVPLLLVGAWWLSPWFAGDEPVRPGEPAALAAAAKAANEPPADARTHLATVERAAVEAEFVVHVLQDDAPVAGATVHRWRADGDIDVATTRANGSASFAPAAQAGGVLVRAGGVPAIVQDLAELRGETFVRFTVGRAVAGRMFVDGAPAPAGLHLELSAPKSVERVGVPVAVEELLLLHDGKAEAVTDANGSFVFAGLAADWAGELRVPRTHWLLPQAGQFAEDYRQLLLAAPCDDVRVATTCLPFAHGRVEWEDGSGPVTGVLVTTSGFTFADGTLGGAVTDRTDAAGRFRVAFAPALPSLRDRWLDPSRRSEVPPVALSVSWGTTLGHTWEAGNAPLDLRQEIVLRLPPPRLRRYRAIDPEGHPIAGARSLEVTGLGEPTGADGIGTTWNQSGTYVGAPGRQCFAAWQTQSGASTVEPVDVVLPKGNALRIRVRAAGGGASFARSVSLVSRWNVVKNSRLNLVRWLGESRFDVFTDAYRLDPRGEATILSLQPGVACRLVVRDRFSGELARREIVTPPLGEEHMIDIDVAAPIHTLRGRVVDTTGAAVPLARITLSATGIRYSELMQCDATVKSASDGSFTFGPFHSVADLVLIAHHPGFGAVERAIALHELAQPLELVLTASRRTTVRIVDTDGAPVPEARLAVDTGTSRNADQQQLGPGEFVCANLPAGEVTFSCWIGGTKCELRHDTSRATAELRVPVAVRVRIERPDGWDERSSGHFAALARRLDAASEPLHLKLDGDSHPAEKGPQLLLPGRYRIELTRLEWDAKEQRSTVTPLGPAAEVELRPGAEVRVRLR